MMAQRKDQMRIIRQDAGFSAKLGFGKPDAGHGVDQSIETNTPLASAQWATTSDEQTVLENVANPVEAGSVVDSVTLTGQSAAPEEKCRNVEGAFSRESHPSDRLATETNAPPPTSRGQVVYIAVSLTAHQAALAETWAEAARCSVQFLIRRVAQGLRDEMFDEWALHGMPKVSEPRGLRSKHPTSVTMTLRPEFAAELLAQHDPLRVLGLARIMGPAFRARFQVAFDAALLKASVAAADEGEGEAK
jgi:hypothetical protein